MTIPSTFRYRPPPPSTCLAQRTQQSAGSRSTDAVANATELTLLPTPLNKNLVLRENDGTAPAACSSQNTVWIRRNQTRLHSLAPKFESRTGQLSSDFASWIGEGVKVEVQAGVDPRREGKGGQQAGGHAKNVHGEGTRWKGLQHAPTWSSARRWAMDVSVRLSRQACARRIGAQTIHTRWRSIPQQADRIKWESPARTRDAHERDGEVLVL